MSDSKLTKGQFADWINQTVGRNVVNEKLMDQLLQDAKESYNRQGLDGFFEYIRQLTQAPVSNEELKKLMDTVIDAGDPSRAVSRLADQGRIPKKRARQLEESMSREGASRKRKRQKNKGRG
ncbi:hypothetical protein [Salinithrix halophila]|uniref:Uncharacterized protein n=1 Tax=Salinithrix halophila TaxID=1485204 RepID=A0ABV8JI36_9BACL